MHFLQTKKFKTINIVVKLSTPLERETITKRALLPYLLNQGTKTYQSEQQLQAKLAELYGAHLAIDGMKKGDNHIISFRLEIANEKFINCEADFIDDALQLLHDIIFNPNVENNTFPDEVFQREKAILANEIRSIVDEKGAYASMRLIDEMYQDEQFGIHVQGYESDLANITAENVYEYYEHAITHDRIDIYVLGDQVDQLEQKTKTLFVKENNDRYDQLQSTKTKHATSQTEVVETEPINQAKLHIGYTTNCTHHDELYFALHVFNGLFGGFPNSKLFVNVREKNSLAYYISSRLESHKGLLIIVCGIDGDDYKKAKQIIDEQLIELKEGKFIDAQLTETIELIISQLKETLDSPQAVIELLFQQVLGDQSLSPQKLIENIAMVTKEDVISVAQNIKEHTVFLLKNERNSQDATTTI